MPVRGGSFMNYLLILITFVFITSCDFNESKKPKDPTIADTNIPSEVPNQEDPTPENPPIRELPLCSELCENSNKIIKSNRSGFSYLSFPNFGHRGVGRCRGHALVTQKFSILAKFQKYGGCDLTDSFCLNELKRGVDIVLNYGVYIFKGYESLFELSKEPVISDYLYNKVKLIGHRYSAGPGAIDDPVYDNSNLNVFYELRKRASFGQLPYVGVVGRQTGSHALLVYGVEYHGSMDVLCVRDPNIVLGVKEDCQSFLYVENSQVFYKRLDRSADHLTRFQLTSDEDRRIRRYTLSLHKACIDDSRKQGICR